MASFLKAPEGVTSASVEGEQLEVDEDGLVRVENGQHAAILIARHGFVHSHSDGEDAPVEEPAPVENDDDPGECPDFSKFDNRQALVDWLVANGVEDASADSKREDLEQACVARHAALVEAFEADKSE